MPAFARTFSLRELGAGAAPRNADCSSTLSEQRLLWYPAAPPAPWHESPDSQWELSEVTEAPHQESPGATRTLTVSFGNAVEIENTRSMAETLLVPPSSTDGKEAAAGSSPSADAHLPRDADQAPAPRKLADPGRTVAAFERMAADGQMRRDCLIWALQLAGCLNPNAKWVDELLDQMGIASSCLSGEEFAELVRLHDSRQLRMLLEKFQNGGGSPMGSESSLSTLLRDLGLVPFPWLVKELNQEVFGHSRVRRGSPEALSRICSLLRECAGFTRKEAAALRAVFARCDRDRDGRLDAAGVVAGLRWLGVENDVPKALAPLARDERAEGSVAKDCKQLPVSETEFLTLVRACRAGEQRRMYLEFNTGNWNWFGTLDVGELPRIFEELGVLPASPDLLQESTAACGLGRREELLFDDICLLRERLRKAHCFSDLDVAEITAAFEEFDHDSSGSIDHAELTGALRWLGYPTTIEGIWRVEQDLWLDHCRHVYSEDFLRFVGEHRDREILFFKKALEKHQGRVPQIKFGGLLTGLGYSLSSEQMTSVMQGASKRTSVGHEGTLGLWDLVRLTAQCRAEIRLKVRQTFGLSEREIAELGRVFRRYDAQDTGIITGDNLIQILKEHQGMEQTSALERLEVVVGNLGAVMYGQVSFKDLLRAVRLLRDYTDWDDFRKRRRAFADLHLRDDEIEGFREVFQRFGATTPGLILFAEVKDMLSRVVPESSPSDDMELARIVKLAVPDGTQAVLHGLDFPDFVRVMMKLQDKNWCEINGNASKIARDMKSGNYTSRRNIYN